MSGGGVGIASAPLLRRALLGAVLVSFLPTPCLAWWNPAWGLRRKITLDNSGQATNLANFPLLVRLDSTRVEYFRTQDAGQDIRFVDADDATPLDHEIELWNEAGSSYVWVRVPQVDAGSTTDHIWMYYDNPSAADGQNVTGVWNAGFRGVWHLKENPAGAPPQMKDSTANVNHGTVEFTPVQTTGQIDGSLAFDAVSEHNVNIPHAASLQLSTDMTVSGWARTNSVDGQARLIVAKWKGLGNDNYWLGKLDGSVMAFGVDGGPNANCPLAFVNDDAWHHVVGVADAAGGRLRIYVDGVERGNSPYSGISQTGTSEVRIGRSPDIALQDWIGGIDEVRVENVARSADWIRAQNLSMRDTFVTFAPAACVSGCQGLTAVEAGNTVTVTSANAFEVVFANPAGGHVQEFYDLAESAVKDAVHDLAGGSATQVGLFIDEINWQGDGSNYRSDKNIAIARGQVAPLEVTPTRVMVRSQSYYGLGAGIVPGLVGLGDWTVYPAGRMALHWRRISTSPVGINSEQIHLNAHYQAAGALNGWAGYIRTGPLCPACGALVPPALQDFVMFQNEQAGARTDFLQILYQDWPLIEQFDTSTNLGQEWAENTWHDLTARIIPADTTESWNLLTYFKPTIFTGNADPAVTSRTDDYRGPDDLASPTAPTAGGGWFDPAENTSSPADFFNENEAAYALDLDPALGLTFDMDGGATARTHPFFKIRRWQSLVAPNTITLEGVALTKDVDFKADVMPISRAPLHQDELWQSTLQDAAAVSTPGVGSPGTLTGAPGFEAARYGQGMRITTNAQWLAFPTLGNFTAAKGSLSVWFRPNYNHDDGVSHDICGFVTNVNNAFVLEKRNDNNLYFRIAAGGAVSELMVAAAAYTWTANDWIHIQLDWDDSLGLASQQRLYFGDREPAHTDSAVNYNAAALVVATEFRFGNSNGDATFSPGLYDEIEMISDVSLLARAGLVADTREYLGESTRNIALDFAPVDANGRGRYLILGATAKFRGLNVGLAVNGAGVPAGALEWEYWNGSRWASLETVGGFTDTTRSLTRSGNVYWNADPAGWVPYSTYGGADLYRIRVHLASGSTYSTFPTEGLIKTDVLLLQYCGDITAAAQTFDIDAPIPTAVALQSFSATARDSAVDLAWTTASELQNLGFHLYRAPSSAGPWTRLTSHLIPGLGSSPTGASYTHRDEGLANGTTYFYLLEDVETTGSVSRHGPVSAIPGKSEPEDRTGGAGSSGAPGSSEESAGSASRITYGDPSAVALQILERGPDHVIVELLTPGFAAETDEEGSVRIAIPGFEHTASPGEVAIPVRTALVEAVAGRKVRLASVTPHDLVAFDSLPIGAEGTRELVVTEEGMVKAGRSRRSLLKALRKGGFAPRLWARLMGSSFQGETKKARLELSPLRHDPASGRTVLARRLVARLEFFGAESGERSLGGSRGRRDAAPTVPTKGVVARLVTTEPGLYRVRFEEIFGSGRRGLNARGLRLSRLGQAVAYHLDPDRALFGPGSSLFFHSEGSALNPLGDAVYELSLGQSALRMPVVAGAPSGPPPTEYVATLALEQNRFYQSALLEARDLWLWDLLVSPVTKSYPFTVDALSPSGTPARLRVVLQGASDLEGIDHHVQVRVNGIPVADSTWDGRSERVVEADVSAGLLVAGANALTLENVGDAGAAYSMVFLNRFEIGYPRVLTASAGKLEGRFEESGRAEVAGLTGPAFVVDTTTTPTGWLRSPEATTTGLAFRVEAGRSYLAAADSAVRRPDVRRGHKSILRNSAHRADWLLVAPSEFLPAAAPLVEWRRRQGLLVKAVALEDVFAEFGYGEASPRALRDFVAFTFHHWRGAPRYVVLLGDSTYDPKDYLHTGVKDRVPTPIVPTSYLFTASDPTLAAVNGEDLLPDLAIGRLSAGSFEQAEALVQKLVAFEQAGRSFAGTAVLVADNADLAGSFEGDQDQIATTVLQNREIAKLYLRDLGASGLRAEIRAAFDSGPGLVSYVGHGATAVWASENVFNNTDVSSLQPQAQQPLLLTLNCLNGFFHFPPFDSLAEAFVKAEGKGAIAAFSPSGLSVNDAAQLYHKALLGELENPAHLRLGDVLLAAQRDYADEGAFPELLSIYHLFGDPGMRIR